MYETVQSLLLNLNAIEYKYIFCSQTGERGIIKVSLHYELGGYQFSLARFQEAI